MSGPGSGDGGRAAAYACFATPIGICAIGWRAHAVRSLRLPAAGPDALLARLLARDPQAAPAEPSPPIAEAIRRVRALLAGECDDLRSIAIDDTGYSDFERRVWAATRLIAPGQTRTYGEIARAIGEPDAARAVGRALGRNPIPVIVPCHRVLAAGGRPGGFSAPGGVATKFRLLAIERAPVAATGLLFEEPDAPGG